MANPTEEPQAAQTSTATPESLSAFRESRRPIVLSYCTWVCPDDRAVEAVDDAFARLERELDAAEGRDPIRIDRVLRDATREAAAERVPAADERTSLVRRIGGRNATCDLMPTLLAARASGRLSEADDDRVARHVRRCTSCRELERRHVAAERAYEAFLRNGVPDVEVPATGVETAPRRFERVEDYVEPVAAEPEPVVAEREPVAAVPEPVAAEPVPAPVPEPTVVASAPAPPDGDDRAGRSPWPRRAAIAALIAGVIAAVAITIAALAGGSDSGEDRAASPPPSPAATEPSPAPEREAPRPEPARDRTAERLEALGDRMLGPQATGPDVSALQRLLGVPRTGAYDEATVQAVIGFQTANGLNPDGNAGPETKRLIAEQPPASR